MDAGNMLKPMLARGELRMVGATTLDEYREHIEKDPALERRFQQVLRRRAVASRTPSRSCAGSRSRYEAHHKVEITDAALVAAATLSDRYITSRFLPDKAIDLVDEAASRLRMEIDSRPVEIDELQRAVDRLKMEELALAQETDAGVAASGWSGCARDLADRQEQLDALNARWEQEKAGLNRVGELKERLDDAARRRPSGPSATATSTTASRLLYAEIPAAEKELAEAARRRRRRRDAMVKEEVGPDDVAEVVAAWTGIPAGRLLEGETAKLLRMEDELGRAAGRPDARPCAPCPTPYAGPGPASPTPTGRPARSCSSARPASARPSWPRRWPTSCSTTSGRWCAST